MAAETFPIDLRQLRPLKLDPKLGTLTDAQKADLRHNIQLCRDTIVFFTALAGAKGLSGHTGRRVRHGAGNDDHSRVHRQRGTDRAGASTTRPATASRLNICSPC